MTIVNEITEFAKNLNSIKSLKCLPLSYGTVLNDYSNTLNHMVEQLSKDPDKLTKDKDFLNKLSSTIDHAYDYILWVEEILDEKKELKHDKSYKTFKELVFVVKKSKIKTKIQG